MDIHKQCAVPCCGPAEEHQPHGHQQGEQKGWNSKGGGQRRADKSPPILAQTAADGEPGPAVRALDATDGGVAHCTDGLPSAHPSSASAPAKLCRSSTRSLMPRLLALALGGSALAGRYRGDGAVHGRDRLCLVPDRRCPWTTSAVIRIAARSSGFAPRLQQLMEKPGQSRRCLPLAALRVAAWVKARGLREPPVLHQGGSRLARHLQRSRQRTQGGGFRSWWCWSSQAGPRAGDWGRARSCGEAQLAYAAQRRAASCSLPVGAQGDPGAGGTLEVWRAVASPANRRLFLNSSRPPFGSVLRALNARSPSQYPQPAILSSSSR